MATTTSTTVDPDSSPPPPSLRPNSIPVVDLRLLSQSELHSLSTPTSHSHSLLNNPNNNNNNKNDVVSNHPKIDRSVFNESAGSRKQTYSRLRLASPPDSSSKTILHRRGASRLRPGSLTQQPVAASSDSVDNEKVVSLLKELFKSDSGENSDFLIPEEVPEVPLSLKGETAAGLVKPEGDTEFLKQESSAPESMHTELVSTDADTELLNPETVPESMQIEAATELLKPELMHSESATELLKHESAHESMDTEAAATEVLKPDAAPELLKPEDAPELIDTEQASAAALKDTEAPADAALMDTEATAAVLMDTEASADAALLDTGAPPAAVALLDTGAPAADVALLESEEPEVIKTETKRKRGRPKKQEEVATVSAPAAKRMRNTMVKKVVVYDDARDREVVNSRGLRVDLVNLGTLEDPYGPEIKRRTEGLSTADELLGFLRGLEGQWGTTRKKRRVVDASDFGDALPIGWKLSLCIKKKEGRVWVFCRRYISPSGRQFESCKDISMYLLSILGEENMDKPNHTNSNNSNDSALNGSSGHAENLYVQEDLKRNDRAHKPSTPPVSLPTDYETQVTPGIVGPVNVHVDDVYKCLKCFLIFERKDDLLDHKSKSHKEEKSHLGSNIPDWSIVVGGIFRCNICHNIFHEVIQYNEHIGTHVTNEIKTAEKPVDPVVSVSAEIDHDMSFVIQTENIDEVVNDLDMNEDVLVEESGDGFRNKCVNENDVPKTNETPAVSVSVSKSEFDLDQDIVGRSNGQDYISETMVQCTSISGEKGCQENNNDTPVCSSFDKLTTEKDDVVYNETSSRFFHGISNGQDAVSENKVHTSSICEEKGFRENINDMHLSSSFDELMSEKDKAVNNESSSGVYHGSSDGQDVVSETRVQTSGICEKKGFQENINDTHVLSPFSELTSEKVKVVNKDSSCGVFNEGHLAETKKLSESESLSLFSDTFKPAVDNSSLRSSKKQDSYQKLGFASVDQVNHGFDDNRFSYNISSSKPDEQYAARNSEFDRFREKEHVNREYFHTENGDKSGDANLEAFQVFRNNASIDNKVVTLSNSSQNGLPANVMDYNTGKNIEFSSLVPPGNNQAFGFQDGDKFDDIFGDKFNENIHELSLAFGNPNSLYEDTVTVNEQKRVGVTCPPVVPSKINDTFDVQTDLRMVNNSMVQELKSGNETSGFQNDGNSVYSGRTWGDFKSDEYRKSEDKKFMPGSSNNQMWKTAQRNHLQSGLVHSHPQIQTPNFHSFDIMSQKAQDGLFSQNERYNPNRSEPVEFSILKDRSEHNPSPFQSGSRLFPTTDRSEHNPNALQSGTRVFPIGRSEHNPNALQSGSRVYPTTERSEHNPNAFQSGSRVFPTDRSVQNSNAVQSGSRVYPTTDRSEHNPNAFQSGSRVYPTDRSEHNPNALQTGSRVTPYTYNTGIEQGFDSTFWMGKSAMMPNMSDRNVVTTVCTWCRNQFLLPAMAFHQQTQAGVVSLCPNCSAGISGQVNML